MTEATTAGAEATAHHHLCARHHVHPHPCAPLDRALIRPDHFVHIPGPNPILLTADPAQWDDGRLEAAGILKHFGTYYLYYHATSDTTKSGYKFGVATADHPLGPFHRQPGPILDLGDADQLACANVIREANDRFVMFYSSRRNDTAPSRWDIEVATAAHPLGPWTKSDKNPIIEDFGYVGSVVKVDGKYQLYTEYPISSVSPDYGPMSLATADQPEGPWTISDANPVLQAGSHGDWDDGGISESAVVYTNDAYHMFYSGAKAYHPRTLTRESIGYAWSIDGRHFTKFSANPVAPRHANPNAAALAEACALVEMPFIYIYHTLRYCGAWHPRHEQGNAFAFAEDLGVQILVTHRPFSLDMPILSSDELASGQTTPLHEAAALPLGKIQRAALTIQCRFDNNASQPLQLAVYSSPDGLTYDTAPMRTIDVQSAPGVRTQHTTDLDVLGRFVKVAATNPPANAPVKDLLVTATLHG